MTSHVLQRNGDRRRIGNRLLRLGWNHYWLLAGVLATMVALVLLVLFAQLAANQGVPGSLTSP
jgi:hypothetical protein